MVQDDAKLVPTQTAEDIGMAYLCLQKRGKLSQEVITGRIPRAGISGTADAKFSALMGSK